MQYGTAVNKQTPGRPAYTIYMSPMLFSEQERPGLPVYLNTRKARSKSHMPSLEDSNLVVIEKNLP